MHQLLAWRQFPGHNTRSWKPNRAWISQRAEQTEVRTQKSGIQEMSWPSPTEEGTAQTESSRNLQETFKMLATYLCTCETELGLPKWLRGKEPACQCRRCRFHPWVGKIPWSRKWESTQYSCLEDSMDRGAWQAAVHGVAKSQGQMRDWAHMHAQEQTSSSPVFPMIFH